MTVPDSTNFEMFACEASRRLTQAYQEGHISPEEMEPARRHMAQCAACAEDSLAVRSLRSTLRSTPAPVAPADLRTRLRVSASKEASRRRTRQTLEQRWAAFRSDVRLWSENLMRPLAIPAAGGIVSAFVLFAVFVSSLTVPSVSASTGQDVPTGLYTEASVVSYLPIGMGNHDLVVEVTVDDQGRVIEYSMPNAHASVELRRSIENRLLFTQFKPATSFGQPTTGKLRIRFHSSSIDVKG